jgi:hypothetical protein
MPLTQFFNVIEAWMIDRLRHGPTHTKEAAAETQERLDAFRKALAPQETSLRSQEAAQNALMVGSRTMVPDGPRVYRGTNVARPDRQADPHQGPGGMPD